MNPIYRGQYPPKNTNVLWIKDNQIYIYQNGGWEAASGSGGKDAEEYLSETSESLIKNKAVYNQYMTENDTMDILRIVDPNIDYSEPLTFEFIENSSIAFVCSSSSFKLTISYKKTTEDTWHTLQSATNQSASIVGEAGDKIQVKGNNLSYTDNSYVTRKVGFKDGMITGKVRVYGNIMSLVNGEYFKNIKGVHPYAFSQLFRNNTYIVDASKLLLPATTLKEKCYESMFKNCSNLESAPELPTTNLDQYCYSEMFYGCVKLTKGPSELPATVLKNYCYSSMFYNCASIETVPILPAQTSVNQCYYNMLRGCPKLKEVTCLLTTISSPNDYNYWLYQSGTEVENPIFKKAPTMSGWTVGDNCIPSNWTIVNNE